MPIDVNGDAYCITDLYLECWIYLQELDRQRGFLQHRSEIGTIYGQSDLRGLGDQDF
jgi:hypothetical protein